MQTTTRKKTGPKPARPDGAHITARGYLRRRLPGGRCVLEHVRIWIEANGPIPPRLQLHHRNGDKLDNRLENLELVDPTTHKRTHGGCELRDGIWWKPCKICLNMKPIDATHWYMSKEGWPLYGRCRSCHCDIVSKRRPAPGKSVVHARRCGAGKT
jgi:hypothetical protein